jgi:hypothetical protein
MAHPMRRKVTMRFRPLRLSTRRTAGVPDLPFVRG